jgi:YYY domain-containing protein
METFLRDLAAFISWYLTISVVGLLAFPLVFRYLPALRDRGYTFARLIGLLAWGFLFWMLSTLGVLENTLAGQVLALVLLVLISGLTLRKQGLREIIAWLRKNRKLMIVTEIVFLASFALWAFIRSANPEISGTEKPMELAFINAILHSPGMPPNDPWLSGYAISYYYFGYVLVAMLTRMTDVLSGVSFNLAIALWFAFSATGAYGIVFNLLGSGSRVSKKEGQRGIYSTPLFGPLFLLIAANLEGFLELLHGRGLFWKHLPDGSQVSAFWSWLDILDLKVPPQTGLNLLPIRYLSWWRASRVLQDYDFLDGAREIIDEFPQFSFLLSDLHPHVLAMPFVLLGIALALNLFHSRSSKGLSLGAIQTPFTWETLAFTALCLGSLGFLNLWDFPFAVLLFTGAYLLKRYRAEPLSLRLLLEGVFLFFLVTLSGVVLYLPFYLGFSSQAGGLIPSLIYATRGAHFWVMFAPLLVPVVVFLLWRLKTEKAGSRFWDALQLCFLIFFGAFILMSLVGWAAWSMPSIVTSLDGTWIDKAIPHLLDKLGQINLEVYFSAQGQSYLTVFMTTVLRRMQSFGAWLSLLLIAAGVLALLMRPKNPAVQGLASKTADNIVTKHQPDFILVVMAVGLLLLTIPEFFYLKDQFGWRMNTIFKFYYHGWILLSICAAYAFIRNLLSPVHIRWVITNLLLLLLLAASLVYAPIMLDIKTNSFGNPQSRTLDGNQYFTYNYPDEAQAIDWLGTQDLGVVAEAIGGSYTAYARVSTLSGFPTVLGWPGHESQWRGGYTEMGTRYDDINLLYATNDWATAEALIRSYDIRYIFIGDLERSTYPVNEIKFRQNLAVVYEQGSVIIFEVTDSLQ